MTIKESQCGWQNISVWFGLTKRDFKKMSQNDWLNSSPFTNLWAGFLLCFPGNELLGVPEKMSEVTLLVNEIFFWDTLDWIIKKIIFHTPILYQENYQSFLPTLSVGGEGVNNTHYDSNHVLNFNLVYLMNFF